jgi:hypothetical protein
MLASFVNTCFGALDPRRGHRPVFLQFETREPGAGAGMPDERDRNRVSVSKSICHSEFPESTRAQGSVHSESAPLWPGNRLIDRCSIAISHQLPTAWAIFAAIRRASFFGQALIADWRCDS